jgi:hypothetical protein
VNGSAVVVELSKLPSRLHQRVGGNTIFLGGLMMRVLVLFLFLGASASKEFILPVLSPSHPDAPVVVYGTITAREESLRETGYSCSAHLSLANVSGKSIVLLVTDVEASLKTDGVVRSRLEEVHVNDYFFQTDLFEPKATKMVETNLSELQLLRGIEPDVFRGKLGADARVIFVQFADGSTWRDLEVKEEKGFFEQRVRAWNNLQLLADVYHTKGAQHLVAVLPQVATGPFLGNLAIGVSHDQSSDAIVRQMEELLQITKKHLRDMSGLLTGPQEQAAEPANASQATGAHF